MVRIILVRHSIRNTSDFGVTFLIVLNEPTIATIIHENASTTIVLIAVATSESVFLIPHFASTEVIPVKNAERTAITSHI